MVRNEVPHSVASLAITTTQDTQAPGMTGDTSGIVNLNACTV